MTTPKTTFAGLALIVALCAGFTLGLAAPAGFDEGAAAYNRGDYATAIRVWRPLAEQGNANAQSMLGLLYGKGQGVPQDYAQAHMWYNLAASSSPPGKNRNIVTKRMTPAQISEAQKLAREWRQK